MFLRGDRRRRPRARLLLAYGLVLLASVVTLAGRPEAPSVPAAGGVFPRSEAKLSPGFLKWALGAGFPTLGLVRPEPFAGLTARGAFTWLLAAATPISPGDPASVLENGLPWIQVRSRRAPVRGKWPSAQSLAPQTASDNPAGLTVIGQKPVVGVYETMSRHAFLGPSGATPGGIPPESSDPTQNVTSVGLAMAKALAKDGVPALHSGAVNDAGGMLGAYVHSAAMAKELVKEFPSIRYLIDVDRAGSMVKTVTVSGSPAAPVTLVVGTATRLPNPGWQQNMAFAKRLGAALQYVAPGILSGITSSADRLNQEIMPGGAVTVDIGGENSTMAEEQTTASLVAKALASVIGNAPGAAAPSPTAVDAPGTGG